MRKDEQLEVAEKTFRDREITVGLRDDCLGGMMGEPYFQELGEKGVS